MSDGPRPPVPFTLGYRPAFDGIRGVAVLIVMAAHSFIGGLGAVGALALQMFFVLSGFLITVLLLREWERTGSISLRNFYLRRALRLLPALLAFLAVISVAVMLTFPGDLRRQHVRASVATIFYFYNWALIYDWFSPSNVLGQCWSLSVEEQFYMLWPLALIALLRLPISRVWKLRLVGIGIVASVIARAVMLWHPQSSPYRVLMGSDMHADSLLLGCLIGMRACWGLLPARPRALRTLNVFAAVSFVFLTVYSLAITNLPLVLLIFDAFGGQGLRVLMLGALFLTLLVAPPRSALLVLESPLMLWFGRRSYSIYLWHLGTNAYLQISAPSWSKLQIAIVGAVVSISAAAIAFRWLEAPFLRIKARYSAEPASALAVIAQTSGEKAAAL
jgi:peptidoglycan/LPS O-acetylase OafA/YrhL